MKALKISWSAWRRGWIITTLGRQGNVLRFKPPLNIHREDLEDSLRILEEAVRDVAEGRVPDEAVENIGGWGVLVSESRGRDSNPRLNGCLNPSTSGPCSPPP